MSYKNSDAHKERMKERKEYRAFLGNTYLPVEVRANVGVNHPDYGLHPQAHWKNKKERDNGQTFY